RTHSARGALNPRAYDDGAAARAPAPGATLRAGDPNALFWEVCMASLLNPYLSFDGDARQALEFYKDVFGGELRLNTFGEVGHPGAENSDKIMHGMLTTTEGFTLMGSDMPPGMEHKPGNNFAVSLSGEDESTLRGYWDK